MFAEVIANVLLAFIAAAAYIHLLQQEKQIDLLKRIVNRRKWHYYETEDD